MKALIIGGTGATGKDLVSLLLEDDTISEVHSFVRKASSSAHPKLKSHMVDFEQPDTWAERSMEILRFRAWELPLHRLEAKKPSGV